jgi:hypothetical protein
LCPDQLWGPPSLLSNVYQGMSLISHFHLVPRSGVSRSYTSSLPWYLHGGSGTAFPFRSYICFCHLVIMCTCIPLLHETVPRH